MCVIYTIYVYICVCVYTCVYVCVIYTHIYVNIYITYIHIHIIFHIYRYYIYTWLPCSSAVKTLPAVQELQKMEVWPLGWEESLEEEMAIHSTVLAWRIPWIKETGGLIHRVTKSPWSDLAFTHIYIHRYDDMNTNIYLFFQVIQISNLRSRLDFNLLCRLQSGKDPFTILMILMRLPIFCKVINRDIWGRQKCSEILAFFLTSCVSWM